jgi:hypothetical protein
MEHPMTAGPPAPARLSPSSVALVGLAAVSLLAAALVIVTCGGAGAWLAWDALEMPRYDRISPWVLCAGAGAAGVVAGSVVVTWAARAATFGASLIPSLARHRGMSAPSDPTASPRAHSRGQIQERSNA